MKKRQQRGRGRPTIAEEDKKKAISVYVPAEYQAMYKEHSKSGLKDLIQEQVIAACSAWNESLR